MSRAVWKGPFVEESLIKKVDENIIQQVIVFDVFEGENIPNNKKSVAINVTLQALEKTLNLLVQLIKRDS